MKKPLYISAATLALMLTESVYAGGFGSGGVYVGGSVGQSNSSLSSGDIFTDYACSQGSDFCDDETSDTGYGVHAGLEWTDSISFEVGAVDLGETSMSVGFAPTKPLPATTYIAPTGTGMGTTYSGSTGAAYTGTTTTNASTEAPSIRRSTRALTAAVIGKKHLSDGFSVYGKAGMAAWQTKTELRSTSVSQNIKETGFDPFVGAGVEYAVSDQMSVRAGVERYFNVGGDINSDNFSVNMDSAEDDLDFYSVGVSYKF